MIKNLSVTFITVSLYRRKFLQSYLIIITWQFVVHENWAPHFMEALNLEVSPQVIVTFVHINLPF